MLFETPPGWGLQLRSPINMRTPGFHVMEAMLETDWLQQDIWLNLVFHREGEKIELRREQWPPHRSADAGSEGDVRPGMGDA